MKRTREVRAEHATRPGRAGKNGVAIAQREFAFMERFAPTPKVLAARDAEAAAGRAAIAQPGMLFSEMKGTLTVPEAAQDLSISDQKIYELIEEGELEAFWSGSGTERKHRRILAKSVIAFINRRKA